MFITVKRHEREKQELISASSRLTDAILKSSTQGLFLIDAKAKVLPQVSASLGPMFRRQDFANLSFEKLLAPLVAKEKLAPDSVPPKLSEAALFTVKVTAAPLSVTVPRPVTLATC